MVNAPVRQSSHCSWTSAHISRSLCLAIPSDPVCPKDKLPPQILSFSYLPHVDTTRFLAAQSQDLFLILCILHVTKSSYYFLFEVALESVSSPHPPLHSSGPRAPSSPSLPVLALGTPPLEHCHTLLTLLSIFFRSLNLSFHTAAG